ncbi:AAA family ATPase, partial [Spirulina sp. 06S082]|uniref:AAA family ATPase n=1 Tax=Spirulina sp. 06S082 TaxID=3110248 RepID=UPI002B20EDC1
GWLPNGSTTLLYAPGGTGKTLLGYDFVYHLLTGLDWNEFSVPKRTKGLIVQTDETESDMIGHLTARGFTDEMDVKIKTDWSMEYLPQLYKEILDGDYDWVMIDSLSSASKFSTIDENSVQYAIPILRLNKIAAITNTHILLLHHASKGDGSVRGSSAIQAAVSQVIKLDYDKDSSDNCMRIASFTKSRVRSPGSYRIRLHADDDSGDRNYWTVVEEISSRVGIDLNSDWKTTIKHFLKRNLNKVFSARSIAEGLHANYDTIRKCVGELAGTGEIGRKERPGKLANLYFIGNPKNLLNLIGGSSLSQQESHHRKPDVATDSLVDDRAIAEISENFLEKIPDNEDHRIIKPDKPSDSKGSVDGILDEKVMILDDRIEDRCDSSPQLAQEEDIAAIAEMLELCKDLEDYEAIVSVALQTMEISGVSDDLLGLAVARLSPEERSRIEAFNNPSREIQSDFVIDDKSLDDLHFVVGDRVVAVGSNLNLGIGEVLGVGPDQEQQVRVRWSNGDEARHWAKSLVKAGSRISYAGENKGMKKVSHYNPLFTVKRFKEKGDRIRLEVSHEGLVAPVWLDLDEFKR